MPDNKQFKRYGLIVEYLKTNQFIPLKDILVKLKKKGIDRSKRTLQRDIEILRKDYGIAIEYQHKRQGYIMDQDTIPDGRAESFYHMLGIVNTADLLMNSLSDSKEFLKYVTFDSVGSFKGIEYLQELVGAIRDTLVISFDHLSYQSGDKTIYKVFPYGLREYRNRWYLVAIPEKKAEFQTFGLDRIKNLQVSDEKFKRDPHKDPFDIFNNLIGIWGTSESVQKVVLSFSPWRSHYLKSLPIHSSQNILIDNETEFRIELFVKPNFGLEDQILMYGDSVKVIEPESLIEKIKSILIKTISKY